MFTCLLRTHFRFSYRDTSAAEGKLVSQTPGWTASPTTSPINDSATDITFTNVNKVTHSPILGKWLLKIHLYTSQSLKDVFPSL